MALLKKEVKLSVDFDKNELEMLIAHFEQSVVDLKNTIFALDKSTTKAARVMQDLNRAVDRARAEGQTKLTGKSAR